MLPQPDQSMVQKTRYLSMKTFRDFGYLQEVNRLFFHPLGLALDISADDEGKVHLYGIQDWRSEAGGYRFGPGMIDDQKMVNVFRERASRADLRFLDFGDLYQQPDVPTTKLDPNAKSENPL